MNIVNNIIEESMITLLKAQIGKKFVSFKYDYFFNDKQTANSSGIECIIENNELIISSDIKFFNFLDGEDYSFIKVIDEQSPEYPKKKSLPKKEFISVNQTITDIQIVTDSYHCSNSSEGLDSTFICDYAIIFILENCKICFEKYDIFEDELIIHNIQTDSDISFYDNSEDFESDNFTTERNRTIKSVKD